ncbi:endonuclease MutS2 [Raineya orbicola]|uniref:Endonuclease MutS2 n=1 Tax=Raineya orbicola TaxID=2016530 RepID=A0A2N3IJ71_9BACT|nr:endonuclease MutS2 [Raineya orbicola]PKQ70382.1 mutS2: MutS2 family protein [Raineya orbicola]
MLYPKNIEQKLGFDKIRELIAENCLSNWGLQYLEKMRFSDDYEHICKLTAQTQEMKEILLFDEPFPNQNFLNVQESLQKIPIQGAFLSENELFQLKISLSTIRECYSFLQSRKERYLQLAELLKLVEIDKKIFQRLEQIVDDRGNIRDSASATLQDIRRKIISEEQLLQKTTDKILRQAKQAGWANEEASLTIRGGRIVIPIAAEHKRKLKGFIHDESATGQTIFIEPAEILDLNNTLKELQAQERREIIRILTEITDFLRPFLPNLQKAYQFLGLIDFIMAKAKFAIKINANAPIFEKKTKILWKNAIHPLLWLLHSRENKPIVPLNIELSENQRIIVVSGPNAGGKSVALKTVGLLQYMWQCGLLVPMVEGSVMGVFQDIFIDIGDEQSLENDLSTYSSHLTAMRQFVNLASEKTLFLIDEFGTGTEPRLGGAIAEAILEDLCEKKAFGMINTHYGNLKTFAQNKKGITNAAMRFDMQNLEPLYELEIGQAGSSFAFEIAKKIGLPKKILAKAQEKLSSAEINYDKLLKELEQERKILKDKIQEIARKEQEYQVLLKKYQEQTAFLEKERKKLLNEAKIEAKKLLQEANQKIEQTIRQIREQKAEKNITKDLRKNLEEFRQNLQVEEVIEENENQDIEVISGEIQVGDWVRIKGQNTLGEVLQIQGKDAEIAMGELRSVVKLNRLEKISRKEAKNEQKKFAKKSIGINLTEKLANFSSQIDVRGKSTEVALQEVDKLLDDALLAGFNEVRILHGKGDGILRKMIREHLKKYDFVASFASEHADRGGDGYTIVKIK